MHSDTRRVWGGKGRSADGSLPQMLFKLDEDIVTRSLVRALSDCFPDYDVNFVTTFSVDPRRLSLLSFGADPTDDPAAIARDLRQRCPNAVLVMLVQGVGDVPAIAEELVREGYLQGVLPLTLPLPVWLAAFGLLLNGGVYFPPDILSRRQERNGAVDIRPPVVEQSPHGIFTDADLTRREQEVLNLLALGFQNKIIALRLALSEHTVKIHVHNIIRKLGVHNRTEAAAHRLNSSAAGATHPTDAGDDRH